MSEDTNYTENGNEDRDGTDDGARADDREDWRRYPDRLLEQGRERGLSKADRRFLASGGETVNSEQMAVNTRTRIRKRIRASIVDFWLLTEYLDDHDRDLVFREQKDDWDNWELQIGLKNAMQFFYTALEHTDLTDFETVLTSAIHDAERRAHDGPALVEVDFDVEVDEEFHVQEAYNKFRRGIPLKPAEIGALLITGRVSEPEKLQKLARHAHSNGFVEHSIAPLLGEQLAEISGEEQPVESFYYTTAHLSDTDVASVMAEDLPSISDFARLKDELWFTEVGLEHASVDALADESLTEELANEEDGEGVPDLDSYVDLEDLLAEEGIEPDAD